MNDLLHAPCVCLRLCSAEIYIKKCLPRQKCCLLCARSVAGVSRVSMKNAYFLRTHKVHSKTSEHTISNQHALTESHKTAVIQHAYKYYVRYFTSGTHAVSRTDSEYVPVCLVCLSVRSGLLKGRPRTNSKRLRPCRTHQVGTLAEVIVVVRSTPHRVPCVRSYQSWLLASQSGSRSRPVENTSLIEHRHQ